MIVNVLLSLFALFLAVLAYTESRTVPPADPVAGQGPRGESLLDLLPEAIGQVKIIDRHGCLIVCTVAGDPGTQERVTPLLEAITQARIVRRFAPPTRDVSGYGLARPDRRIGVWRRGSSARKVVTIGGSNPVGNAVYARVGDTAEVVMIGSYFLAALDMAVQRVRAAGGGGRGPVACQDAVGKG
ncbi:MAG: DUF4340 domain-containing protein [Thermodesulfobacteriota bacterium]